MLESTKSQSHSWTLVSLHQNRCEIFLKDFFSCFKSSKLDVRFCWSESCTPWYIISFQALSKFKRTKLNRFNFALEFNLALRLIYWRCISTSWVSWLKTQNSKLFSMTSLLMHTVANFTWPSSRPKTYNQPLKKKFKSCSQLSKSCQKWQNSDFQSQ